ncbi:hypothetical protein F5Y15DRAFT_145886 [Xylariaceae sp. FL0016]|nr:hypothetical protein F5Y15DRAFT_145886 [Xylariaceae sp. FL0016]
MSAPPPPPPPPPHGENPKTTNGNGNSNLPPGKYDIFIIPPHSSGSGFLYLPSLKPNANSFAAGFASALILVVMFQSAGPAFRAWWSSVQGMGNMGMLLLVAAVGVGAWALGRTQQPGGSGPGPGGGHGNSWEYGPNGGAHSGGPSPNGGSAPDDNVPPPRPPPHNSPPRQSGPPPSSAGDKPKSSWNERPAGETPKGSWEKAREETRRKEEERKTKEAEQRRKDEIAKRLKELREKEARERAKREKDAKDRKEREEQEKAQREKEQREKEAKEKAQQEQEKARREKEQHEKDAKEKAQQEQEKARREKEIRENRLREARERELRERLEREKALREKYEKEAKEREEATAKAKATEAENTRKSTYAFSAVGEKTNPWPNGKPPQPPSPAKPNPTPASAKRPPPPTAKSFRSAEEETYSYRPYDQPKAHSRRRSGETVWTESSYAPSISTSRSTPPPSMRGPYTTKDPDKIVIKAVYGFLNQYSKTPASQLISGFNPVTDGLILRITTEGLFIDDDVRGVPQREWDVKAWTLKTMEVWCPSHCFSDSAKAPQKSGNSRSKLFGRGQSKTLTGEDADTCLMDMLHSCKDECRFGARGGFDDDASSYANGSQSGEWKHRGLHVLRATIRDQEGKRYMFVLGEEEGWKVAVGLQRLRKGSQVRQLGIQPLSAIEARNTLEMLGW